jgi:hypothetical protein
MPTRIYTQSSGTPAVTPSTWNFASQINPVSFPGTLTLNDGSAMTSQDRDDLADEPPCRCIRTRYSWATRCTNDLGDRERPDAGSENNAGANATLALAIKIIQPDGTDRGVLLAQTASDSATAGHELTTTLTNMSFQDAAESASIALTSQAATQGDYLVIEWGIRSANTTANRTVTLSYGNNSATDLGENTTETTANNPWWEFSGTITLFVPPLTVNVTDAVTVGELVRPGPMNGRHGFTTATTVVIPGFGTPNVLVQVYDTGTPASQVQPGLVTVDSAAPYDITLTFAQAQSGYAVVNSGPASIASQGNYAQAFTGQTSVTVAGSAHALRTSNLIVQVYDAAAQPALVQPGSVTIAQDTYDVVVTFRQNQSGTIVVNGYTQGVTNPFNAGVAFTTPATTVTVTQAQHGFTTNNLLVQVYDNGTPRTQLDAGSVSVDPSSHDVTLTFRQNQTGMVVIDGSQQAAGFAPAVTDAITVGETVVVMLRLTLAVTDGVTVGDTTSVAPVLRPSVSDGVAVGDAPTENLLLFPAGAAESVAVGETVSIRLPSLLASVTEAVTLTETSTVLLPVLPVSIADSVTVGESSPALLPVLTLQVSENVTLTDVATLLMPLLLIQATDPVTVGETVTVLAGQVGLLQVSVSDALTVGETTPVLLPVLLLASTDALVLSESLTIREPFLLVAVSDVVTIGESSAALLPLLLLAVTDSLNVGETRAISLIADLPNYAHTFTNSTVITIPGTTHGCGTAALLIQVYDASTNPVQVTPGSITVDGTSFDVTVTLDQAMSGTVVLNGGRPLLASHRHYVQPFSATQTVTIPGTSHGFGHTALLVQVYDNASPQAQIAPGNVTIDGTTFDVTVTFRQNQTGKVLVGGYARTNTVPNVTQGFTNVAAVTILGSTHLLQSPTLFAQVYDAAATPAMLTPGSVTIDPTSFDVVVTFRQNQSGTVVLNGMPTAMVIAVVDNVVVGETVTVTRVAPLTNHGEPFTNQSTITVLGTSHGAGHANLLVQVYDNATPANWVIPGAVSVNTATFDVTVTLLDTLSGTVVVNGAYATTPALANYAHPFASSTSVTITEANHGFTTPYLLVQVYDTGTPALQLEPASVTVHPTTHAVTVTFDQAQSGTVVVNGAFRTGAAANVAVPFTSVATVTIDDTTHNLHTKNLIVQVYDNAAAAALVTPASITVHPTTFQVIVTLDQAMSGTVVLNGSTQGTAISVMDSVIVGETVTVPWLRIAVSDDVTLTWTPQTHELALPRINNEDVAVTEAVFQDLLAQPTLTETVSLVDLLFVMAALFPAPTADSVSLTDVVTVAVVVQPTRQETVAVTDTVATLVPMLTSAVSDTVTLTEDITVIRTQVGMLAMAVADAVTVTEVTLALVPFLVPAVTDALVVQEQVSLQGILVLTMTDSLTVNETVSALLPIVGMAVSDGLSLAETVTVIEPQLPLAVLDAASLTETVFVNAGAITPLVQDTITVTETLGVRVTVLVPSVSDSSSVGETATAMLLLFSAVTDTVTVTDARTVMVVMEPQVTETVSVTETGTAQVAFLVPAISDGLTLTETVALVEPRLLLAVSDSLAVADEVMVIRSQQGVYQFNISEAVAVSETTTALVPIVRLSVTDTVSVIETGAVTFGTAIAVADGASISDTVSTQVSVTLAVTDGIAVAETTTATVAFQVVSVAESIAIGEALTLQVLAMPTVVDGVAVGETVALRPSFLTPSILESVAVTETIARAISASLVAVTDAVVPTETALANLLAMPQVQDAVAASETVRVGVLVEPIVTESLVVSDVTVMFLMLLPQVQDVVSVGEQVFSTVGIVRLVIRGIDDSLGTSHGLDDGLFIGEGVGDVLIGST